MIGLQPISRELQALQHNGETPKALASMVERTRLLDQWARIIWLLFGLQALTAGLGLWSLAAAAGYSDPAIYIEKRWWLVFASLVLLPSTVVLGVKLGKGLMKIIYPKRSCI